MKRRIQSVDEDGDVIDAPIETSPIEAPRVRAAKSYPFAESGSVGVDDSAIVLAVRLAHDETVRVTKAGMGVLGSGAPPSGLNLIIISLSSGWSGTEQSTIISADGTSKTDVTGSSVASYENRTGSAQDVAIAVDNGHFSAAGIGSTADVVVHGNAEVI